MKMLFLLAVLVFVKNNQAAPAEPARCCTKHQFQANMGQISSQFVKGKLQASEGDVGLIYDYTNKKIFFHAMIKEEGGNFTNSTIWQDFGTNKEYLRTDDGKCVVYPLDQPMLEPCIPANATFLAPATFGYGKESLSLNVWEIAVPQTGLVQKLVVTQQECIPVIILMTGTINGAPAVVNYFISDFDPTIPNKSLLTLPIGCTNLTKRPEGPPVGRRNVLYN